MYIYILYMWAYHWDDTQPSPLSCISLHIPTHAYTP